MTWYYRFPGVVVVGFSQLTFKVGQVWHDCDLGQYGLHLPTWELADLQHRENDVVWELLKNPRTVTFAMFMIPSIRFVGVLGLRAGSGMIINCLCLFLLFFLSPCTTSGVRSCKRKFPSANNFWIVKWRLNEVIYVCLSVFLSLYVQGPAACSFFVLSVLMFIQQFAQGDIATSFHSSSMLEACICLYLANAVVQNPTFPTSSTCIKLDIWKVPDPLAHVCNHTEW